jgi:APA family basic amino acid/polyamine antiporter
LSAPRADGGPVIRQLGLLDTAALCAGSIIGSGIFFLPAAMAMALPATGPLVGVWLAAGLVSVIGALCLAELGAMFPEQGGLTAYLREAFGPFTGFLYGWSAFALTNTVALAAIAMVFAEYLGVLIPMGEGARMAVGIGAIAGFTLLNSLGVREGANAQNLLTGLKVFLMLGLVGAAFLFPGGDPANLQPLGLARPEGGFAAPLAVAFLGALFACDGWINVSLVGGEVRDPGRNLPLAVLWGTGVVVLLYVAVNLAFLWVLGPAGVAGSPLVASEMLARVAGRDGERLVAFVIVVSTLGALNGNLLSSARVPFALAREGRFPAMAGRLGRRGAPVAALVLQGLWAVALSFTGSYVQLTQWMVYGSFIFYGMGAAAVLVLRRRRPAAERPYRVWGYPVTPLLFLAFSVWLVLQTVHDAPRDAAIGTGLILLGVPAYFLFRPRRAG